MVIFGMILGRKSLKIFFVFLVSVLSISFCGRFSGEYTGKVVSFAQVELKVAGQDSGWFSNFIQDKSGGIHLVYYQLPKRTILWAHAPNLRTGFTQIEVIDEAGENDNFGSRPLPRVVVDSKNIPHVIYTRHIVNGESVFRIYHAWRVEDNKWIKEPVNIFCPFEPKAEFLDAAIDPEDIIHIAYIGYDGKLYYIAVDAQNQTRACELIDPAVGEVARVPSGGRLSGCVSLKIDPAGGIHVAYYDAENGNTKYAYKKKWETTWDISVVGWERVSQELNLVQLLGEYEAELLYPSNESKLDTYIFAVGPGGRREVSRDFWKFKGSRKVVFSSDVVGPGKEFDPAVFRFNISYVRVDTSPDDDGNFCAVGYYYPDPKEQEKTYQPFIAYSNSTKSTLDFARLDRGSRSWKIETVDRVFIGSRINVAYFDLGEKKIPAIVYHDTRRFIIKIASPDVSSEGNWLIFDAISRGAVGFHLFADSLQGGFIGLSYIRKVITEDVLFFSVSEYPKKVIF
jgi:hypothetical protein